MLVLILNLFSFTPAVAQTDGCNALVFANGRVQPSLQETGMGAVYGVIANLSTEDDTLIAASTTAAESVEFHLGSADGDMANMELMEAMPIPAESAVEFVPEIQHLMLVNLTQDLVEGETLALTLIFENAGELELAIPIHDPESEHAQHHKTPKPTLAVTGECDMVKVVGAWARPSVTLVGAAYAYIFNLTDEDEILLNGTSDIAEAVEIHAMTMDGDVMSMTPLSDGLPIPAGDMVQFQPGGLHIMLINLTDTLDVDNTFELTFTFAIAGEISLTVPIQNHTEIMNH